MESIEVIISVLLLFAGPSPAHKHHYSHMDHPQERDYGDRNGLEYSKATTSLLVLLIETANLSLICSSQFAFMLLSL